ncbi:MAG: carbon-nitrogen hydrolase [Acidobacteria bacterium]|uniref:Carbon-nitrogen hydrolase n=1 Tax=Candidatus Polarisedimenticola svalbardensis TaxID=2886004 RepID=A0A8J7CEC4_9BACT|nr:carbon-nitrogen hydrolase [Candidatus Polarisedimenticola svalbardensis]
MQTVRVALAQIAPKLGDLQANIGMHLDLLRRGREEGAGLVVFPELSLTGYLLKDQTPDVARTLDSPELKPLLESSRHIDALVGLVEEGEGHRFYNSAVYLSGGKVVHVHRKIHLPTYGMFDEGRDFAAGDQLRTAGLPFGRIGTLICEDVWHSPNAWLLAQDGAEILFVLGSGPTRGARPETGVTSVPVWHDLLRTTAQFQTAQVVYVNRVGYEDGLNFGGGSIAIDPFGREIGSIPALLEGWLIVELEGEVLRRARTAYPLLRDARLELVYREMGRIRTERFGLPEPDQDL